MKPDRRPCASCDGLMSPWLTARGHRVCSNCAKAERQRQARDAREMGRARELRQSYGARPILSGPAHWWGRPAGDRVAVRMVADYWTAPSRGG